jgi:hypothetical protein
MTEIDVKQKVLAANAAAANALRAAFRASGTLVVNITRLPGRARRRCSRRPRES